MNLKHSNQLSKNKYQQIKRNTRIFLVQCFYAWDFTRDASELVVQSVRQGLVDWSHAEESDISLFFENIDEIYFRSVFNEFIKNISKIDEMLSPCVDRKIAALGAVERAILRLSVLELSEKFSVPTKVVINEAIELAKSFGATESFKFINGSLHALSSKVPYGF